MSELQECGPNPFGLYQVKDGDTAASVGDRFGVPPAVIASLNRIKDFPPAGGMLVLPSFSGQTHVVRPGEDLSSVCRAYAMTEEEFMRINGCSFVYPMQRVFVRRR